MRSLIFIPTVVVLLAGSCGSTKESTVNDARTNETSPAAVEQSAPSTAQQAENEVIMKEKEENDKRMSNPCHLLVSFISIGEGVDPNAHDKMDKIYNGWKDQGVKVDVEAIPWGREGEVDYCYTFSDLSDQEKVTFTDEMKAAFKGNSLVQITENEPSRHRR